MRRSGKTTTEHGFNVILTSASKPTLCENSTHATPSAKQLFRDSLKHFVSQNDNKFDLQHKATKPLKSSTTFRQLSNKRFCRLSSFHLDSEDVSLRFDTRFDTSTQQSNTHRRHFTVTHHFGTEVQTSFFRSKLVSTGNRATYCRFSRHWQFVSYACFLFHIFCQQDTFSPPSALNF